MSIEVLGLFTTRNSAEHKPAGPAGSGFDLQFQEDLVKAYDRNGYDRMLIANAATWPDSIPFAPYVAAITKNLRFMIAHRPGFVAPTMAGRMFATIDQQSKGRCGVHIITGANDKELQADGDYSTKDRRYYRSGEYVDVMRKIWTSEKPFDHEGEFYKMNGAFSRIKPYNPNGIPVFWGGSSPESIINAGRYADIYATGIDTLDRTRALFDKVRAESAKHNRSTKFLVSLRLIIGETEEAAWKYAHEILDGVMANINTLMTGSINAEPTQRYKELIGLDTCQDTRLWTGITLATKGTKAVTSLVGTAEQVVDEMMKYYDLGVTHFLMSGFDYLKDPDYLGRTVIPDLRARVARREEMGGQKAAE